MNKAYDKYAKIVYTFLCQLVLIMSLIKIYYNVIKSNLLHFIICVVYVFHIYRLLISVNDFVYC